MSDIERVQVKLHRWGRANRVSFDAGKQTVLANVSKSVEDDTPIPPPHAFITVETASCSSKELHSGLWFVTDGW